MKVGLACPYTWDVPGGVQAHIRDLAETLIALGHEVSVITPDDDEASLPPYAVHAGKAMAVPYNGSVARRLVGRFPVRAIIDDGDETCGFERCDVLGLNLPRNTDVIVDPLQIQVTTPAATSRLPFPLYPPARAGRNCNGRIAVVRLSCARSGGGGDAQLG